MTEEERNQVLEEAARLCDAKYALRAEGGFPREASTARNLAAAIRDLKTNALASRQAPVALTNEEIEAVWEALPGKSIIAEESQANWNRALRRAFASALLAQAGKEGA